MCIMISLYRCPSLPSALTQLKECVALNESSGKRTVIFCEDRLSLAAERTVCAAVGGSFTASVYTFPRFLAVEKGKPAAILSAQGSAMAVRRIMEERSGDLTVFKCMNASDAAQSVYDTIALLLSSGVSPEEVAGAAKAGGLLGGKLKDLSLIYSEYLAFIEKSGKTDRNGYLLNLAPAAQNSKLLKGASVIFFAFQAFTSATRGCISATMSVADDVSGIFIGGNEDIYVNEAETSFLKASGDFGGAKVFTLPSNMCPEAEKLRTGLYDPSGFYGSPMPTGNVYLFSAADEIEEFEYIVNEMPEVKEIVIEDDTFTIDKNRTQEICKLLIEKKINKKIKWLCNARVNLDYETMKLMKKAGCKLIIPGIESGTQEILNNIKKGTTLNQIEEYVKNAKKAKLLIHACYMVGNKGETKETMQNTLNFAIKLNTDTAQFYTLHPYPGTEAYNWAVENGYLDNKNYENWIKKDGTHNCVIDLDNISSKELVEFCDYARKKYYLRPRYIFRKICQSLTSWDELVRNVKGFLNIAPKLFKKQEGIEK